MCHDQFCPGIVSRVSVGKEDMERMVRFYKWATISMGFLTVGGILFTIESYLLGTRWLIWPNVLGIVVTGVFWMLYELAIAPLQETFKENTQVSVTALVEAAKALDQNRKVMVSSTNGILSITVRRRKKGEYVNSLNNKDNTAKEALQTAADIIGGDVKFNII